MMERAGKRDPNHQKYQFWHRDNHPIEPGTSETAGQKLAYLPENPVRAGFVDDPAHYLYSSARDYAGTKHPKGFRNP